MSLRDALSILRRRWVYVVFGCLVGLGIASAVSYTTTPKYESSARLFVSATSSDTTDAAQGGRFAAERVRSYATLVQGQTLRERVSDQFDGLSSPSVRDNVSVAVVPDTVIIEIRYVDTDPDRAQEVAQAFAHQLEQLVEELETPEGVTRSSIQVTIVDEASLSEEPISPQPLRDLPIGLLLGLLAGAATAFGRDAFDSGIKSDEDLADVTAAPVLAHIPQDSSATQRPMIPSIDSMHPRAEAFRVLRTGLQFLNVDSRPHSVVLTSAMQGEGKTSATVNLAWMLARGGSSVALVDSDLRAPRATEYLRMEAEVGLTDVLAGRATMSQALVRHDEVPLALLAAGELPPNPSELLQSQSMNRLIRDLEKQFDYVLIDAPPLLPVTDAAVLSTVADGVLLVVRHGRTTPSQVRRSVDRLEAAGAQVSGIVMSMTPAEVGYGYGRYDATRRISGRRRDPKR
ncbi:MAG: polysaccharide biosynthesis tyrosine autokinase [Ornithinimicrobium sp.]